MNLAVHGLEAISARASPITTTSKQRQAFDFVLANPPFNVNAVDKERLKDMVSRRFPLACRSTDNANYLWIQLFYSSLNEKGRAGFVMANSASRRPRHRDGAPPAQLIEDRRGGRSGPVGPNMFYTVRYPYLWFLDKGKKKSPNVQTRYSLWTRAISTARWTVPIGTGPQPRSVFIANLVQLYRGEDAD